MKLANPLIMIRLDFVGCSNLACSGGGLDLPNKLYSLIREMIEKGQALLVKNFCCRGHELRPTKYDTYGKSNVSSVQR